jgi:hypothetical protein
MARRTRRIWLASLIGRLGLAVAALALAGCATLPGDVAQPVSLARADRADATLVRIAAASTPLADPTLCGFRLLPDGDHALAARPALIGAAPSERSTSSTS